MTTIEEVPAADYIHCYIMMKLTQDGNFTQLPPTYGTHKIMGGMWADKTECQHEQMLRALKGEHYRIFDMKWKI